MGAKALQVGRAERPYPRQTAAQFCRGSNRRTPCCWI